MKIAMVSQFFPLDAPPSCGVATATLNLCRALAAREDVELTVLKPLAPTRKRTEVVADGIRVIALPYGSRVPPGWAVLGGILVRLRGELRRHAFDLVHVQDSPWICRWLPDPTLLTQHGWVEKDVVLETHRHGGRLKAAVLRLTGGWARNRVRQVIAVSPWAARQLASFPGRRAWVIPNALAPEDFQVRRQESAACRFLASGRVCRLKNIHGLLRAFRQVLERLPDAELHLAGSLDDEAYLRECRLIAEDTGISGKIAFLGSLSGADLRKELAQATALVQASYHENAPMSIAEAMAAGIPVVATAVGGVDWMLDGGKAGVLVRNPDAPGELAQAMIRLGTSADERWRLSQAGMQRAQIFRPEPVAEATVAVYREILTNGVQ
ncbi:MAG: glycosyltransferase family 4 protein [Lentisphaeria bacterium]|jgi:glycosyltransferase involved in cell wall biosynthesis